MSHQPKPEVCEHKEGNCIDGIRYCGSCGVKVGGCVHIPPHKPSPASTEVKLPIVELGTQYCGIEDTFITSTDGWDKKVQYIRDAGFTIDDEAADMLKGLLRSHDQQLRQRIVDSLDEYFKGLIAITDPQATKEKLKALITNLK